MLRFKRAEGTAFGWILGLVTLTVLGILFIMLNQGLRTQIQPAFDSIKQTVAIEGQNLNATQILEIQEQEDLYFIIWDVVPIILFVSIIIWIFLNAIKRNKEDMYQ